MGEPMYIAATNISKGKSTGMKTEELALGPYVGSNIITTVSRKPTPLHLYELLIGLACYSNFSNILIAGRSYELCTH